MGFLGSNAGEFFGDWFGDVGAGGATPPTGPGGALLAWDVDSAVQQRYVWRTSILKSWNGYERRVAMLDKPREDYTLGFELGNTALQGIRGRLLTSPDGVCLVPVLPEALTVFGLSGADVTVSASALALVDWAVAGQRVVLLNGDTFEEHTLQSAGGSTITIEATPTGSFPAHVSAIAPLAHVILEDGQGVARFRVNGGRYELAGRGLFVGGTFGTGAAAFSTLTVQSVARNIVTQRPLAPGLAQEQSAAGIEVLDFGGARDVEWSRTAGDLVRSYDFLITDDADRQWWKAFLYAARGRQAAFLMPTWGDDLRVHTNPSGTTLRIYDEPEYAATWFPSLAHRQLQLVATDGTIHYRTVTAAADLGDGTQALTLGATLTATLASVSFLELVRLQSDTVGIEWSGSTGRLQLTVQTIQR
jgi:hypothetical protein